MSIKTVEEFNSKIKRVLITEEEIREATKKVGKEISDSYDGHPILLVSILKGAFVFMADLCREITVPSHFYNDTPISIHLSTIHAEKKHFRTPWSGNAYYS